MHKLDRVLAYIVCISCGCQSQNAAKPLRVSAESLRPLIEVDTAHKLQSLADGHSLKAQGRAKSTLNPLKLLSNLLIVLKPAVLFKSSGPKVRFPILSSSGLEVGNRFHCVSMSENDLGHAGSADRFGLRGKCRFFLDTADVKSWTELLPLGIFHGITTNPILLQRAGVPCTIPAIRELAETAFALGADEFMAQAWGGSADRLYQTGLQLRSIDPSRMVIKVPVTASGVEAATRLALEGSGTRVCLTACYDSSQALIAASAGAEYLAPYLGRMTDAGKDGMDECEQMQAVVDGLGSTTRILVASIRTVGAMVSLAAKGLDTFTFSPEVARALFSEPLTEAAAEAFEDAASSNSTR